MRIIPNAITSAGDIIYFYRRDPKVKVKSKKQGILKGPAEVLKVLAIGVQVRYGRVKEVVRWDDIRKTKSKVGKPHVVSFDSTESYCQKQPLSVEIPSAAAVQKVFHCFRR